MDYSLKFLSAAVISASLAFLTACGGGDDPDALTPSTYSNKLYCNNPLRNNL